MIVVFEYLKGGYCAMMEQIPSLSLLEAGLGPRDGETSEKQMLVKCEVKPLNGKNCWMVELSTLEGGKLCFIRVILRGTGQHFSRSH